MKETMVRKVVGWLQVFGAGWSALVAVNLLHQTHVFTTDPGFAFLFLVMITLVGVAGVQLLREREVGEILSWIAQLVQLVHVTFGEFAIRVVVGPQLTVLYSSKGVLQFYAGITASLNLLRSDGDPSFSLGINLVALGALLLLMRIPEKSQARRDRGRDAGSPSVA